MRLAALLAAAAAVLIVTPAHAQERAAEGGPRNPPPPVTLPTELDRVLRDYETAWRNRDAEALAQLFTTDGFVPHRRDSWVVGQPAIAREYRGRGGALHLRAFAFAHADSVGYIIGAYRTAPDADDAGKFILALRRDSGGRWRIAADLDNANR